MHTAISRMIKLSVLLGVMALMLVGCATQPASGPEAAAPAGDSGGAASGTVERKDMLIIPSNVNIPAPDIWNPYIPGTFILQGMNQNMMEPLFMLNYETGNIDGWLAESYEANDTLDEWTVTLRDGTEIPAPPAAVLHFAHGASLLAAMPENGVRFVHHLLQEYFAAEELLRRHDAGDDLADRWRVPWKEREMPPAPRGEWDPLPPPPPTGWEQTTILAASLYPDLVDAVLAVNPALAAHGGFASLVEVRDESIAVVTMGGGCQGCAVSALTLREGIQKSILEHIPEITEVVDATDHDAGENPFYTD